ncbi:FAD-dependent oxidoreductase [Celeribacter litoreus]|uniref:FAD-dependent oxidoreductase n=1 Tax=Celeribacter litoreus TaxID=2876714 RepID=UPI001CCBE091|nr:FAD-dependent oxidoreductase [Celeribacter litoreus]MCA0044910.1 FAD-dependent oxidoreductase [Celeribacter litoreus]
MTEHPSVENFDLVVVGSGAGGLSAAVTAAVKGLRVALLEKEDVIGGTSAWSGGWIFAPRNPVAVRAGIKEDISAPRDYLKAVTGNFFRAEKVESFLENAPEMVGFFEEETALEFEGGLVIPDTYGHQPGAGTGGRSVIAAPFDARELGDTLSLLREPLPETSFKGMTIQSGPDLKAFMTMTRSPKAFAHVTARVVRHFRDLAFHGRGMDLRNGAALIGRLLLSAKQAGVDFRVSQSVSELIVADGTVQGVRMRDGSELRAGRGVVLACGGFGHDLARRAELFERNSENLTLAVPSATGDGLRLGEGAGAALDTDLASATAYCPVSHVTWPNGDTGTFPHIIDRGKPGLIGVLQSGKRFCNEGLGYHDYVTSLLTAVDESEPARSWLVCDHRFLRRFGLGIVRPAPVPFKSWVKTGYLKTGRSIAELATACGIDPEGLQETIAHWNENARRGEDPEFGRGSTPYMRLQGDPEQKPNPNVAPIETGPYYAVEVVPGSFGTFAGLKTDGLARVLTEEGTPIDGLYAAGTDNSSVFGGFYPAGGINLGPAMTFGYVAGRHAALKEDNE